jgi:hypothetical protein
MRLLKGTAVAGTCIPANTRMSIDFTSIVLLLGSCQGRLFGVHHEYGEQACRFRDARVFANVVTIVEKFGNTFARVVRRPSLTWLRIALSRTFA